MTDKVRWGVLGVAKIATAKVIPAMQQGRWTTVTAIASRDLDRARAAAASLGIPKAYGSYDELLNDPEIDAIYNPLPNQLHLPWSIRAAEGVAGEGIAPYSQAVQSHCPSAEIDHQSPTTSL